MILTRRGFVQAGGLLLACLRAGPVVATDGKVEVSMIGKADGSRVWFDPVGVHIQPGQAVRWTNRDPGNSHTVTAYHPDMFDRPLRIPADARPWHSDYLLPNESFTLTLSEIGVYDYYCVPHEHVGMVGRIVVGMPAADAGAASDDSDGLTPLPGAAMMGFPSVADIVAKGAVRRPDRN